MTLFEIFLSVCLIPIIVQLIEMMIPFRYFQVPVKETRPVILVPMRNEASVIAQCIEAVKQQDTDFKAYFADDNSDDHSFYVAQRYTDDPKINVFKISNKEVPGKAGALDMLVRKERHGTYCFTDADVQILPSWSRSISALADERQALVNGVTVITGKGWLATFQRWDWLSGLIALHKLSNLGMMVTGVGNNMALPAGQFWKTGGYRAFPFNLTEDLQLWKELKNKNVPGIQTFQQETMAFTYPAKGLHELFHQRHRWGRGAKTSDIRSRIVLGGRILFFLLCIPLLLVDWRYGVAYLLVKSLLDAISLSRAATVLKIQKDGYFWLPLYQIFHSLFTTFMIIWLSLPIKVTWKGNKF